ncbi:hypothetical protein PG913_04480 [Tenacibaculum pacificus]|uniref:hypothetical protein n=1 Tax=Tenacibaculum pacificus TaxID=3018314 RepID=UPI0022F3EC9B|nr:hypothetical protein [Tenacibaculum pacificus]WBX74457.1 hypothetical protein PG913_04480 [Tenacibaculum pacificus]
MSASRKKLSKNSFKGLKDIESMFIGGYYKYYYGSSSSFLKVKKSLTKARKTGYKDAWVVAFKGDKRISIKEALKKH